MNILFLTLARISDISVRGIYTDMIREFIRHGHTVHLVVPIERRFHQSTSVIKSGEAKILKVKTLNIQKTNIIEKGIGTLLLELQYQHAIQKYWGNIKFDLVLYSTPPITFNKVIALLKKRYKAKTYLLLKDIFPQNAVDLGLFSEKSLMYRFFRKKEKKLYEISDYIGCMSPANVQYLLKYNSEVEIDKVEICPNCIDVDSCFSGKEVDKNVALHELNIPMGKTIFLYGGNLGIPQGIHFLLEVIAANEEKHGSFIVIVGNGTEYNRIRSWFDVNNPRNACLLSSLPKLEYDNLVKVCDVGLIFLDKRFTIPNYPSRLLSYLENKKPVLLATDMNTDIGKIAEDNKYGLWTESGNIDEFMKMIDFMVVDKNRMKTMGENGYSYLLSNYTVQKEYEIIMKHF